MDAASRKQWIEVANRLMTSEHDKRIASAQYNVLMDQLDIAVWGLEWFSECKAEAYIDPKGEAWKAEILNELCIKPINREAKKFLDEMKSPQFSIQ